ncbi:MAG: methyltransferase domain-containing protein [Gemmatales bacterium]|nr:methyltransferase domain-containing protein [Gemmatales bacterium]MDW7994097.1 methyltransferase domain-containing protein [Gemmatales bacterium]
MNKSIYRQADYQSKSDQDKFQEKNLPILRFSKNIAPSVDKGKNNRPGAKQYTSMQALAEFERWSRTYDRSLLQYLLFEPTHQVLLRYLGPGDRKILDIGCGTGKFLVTIAERFPATQLVGLDLCPGMLQRASERCQPYGSRICLVRGDSTYLPFQDNQFDVVTCSHSFHHYPDQQRAIAEMYRILRPNGRLLLVDGDRDGWWGWFIYDICVPWIEGGVHHCSARQFRQLCQAAGFQQIQQTRFGYLAPFLVTVAVAAKSSVAGQLPVARAA